MNLKSAQTAKVGKIFKNARLLKSLSLDEVSTEAIINVEYIRGIESGDYSIFPARTYALKYFEKYAKFLSINPKFFDIYNADLVAKAEQEEQARSVKKDFLENNKVFVCLLVILTLIAIIFLMIPSSSINKKSIQIIESSKSSNNLESNIYSRESFKLEIMELNNQINSFLYTNNLDSSQVNVNVDSIEPDA
tara:strand:- start:617 stop:1192 length:576 start_codon:yes stop_codon:yes gene_type:complete